MWAIFRIIEGVGAGFEKSLRVGEEIIVGRDDSADVPCGADLLISRKHFRLRIVQGACLLEDLGSSNGTEVNGILINEPVQVRHGDEIRAGDTLFCVELQDGTPAEIRRTQLGDTRAAVAGAAEPTLAQAAHTPPPGEYRLQKTPGGLFQYSGFADQLPPEKLAQRLSHRHPTWLILDPSQVQADLPETPEPPAPLFNFLDPAVAAGASPVILPAGAMDSEAAGGANSDNGTVEPDAADNGTDDRWTQLIKQAWGADALIVFHTASDPADVAARLQAAVKRGAHGAVVGLCWPGVLYSLLAHDRSGAADALVDLAETVLIESPDAPQNWELFSRNDLSGFFNQYGLRQMAEHDAMQEA